MGENTTGVGINAVCRTARVTTAEGPPRVVRVPGTVRTGPLLTLSSDDDQRTKQNLAGQTESVLLWQLSPSSSTRNDDNRSDERPRERTHRRYLCPCYSTELSYQAGIGQRPAAPRNGPCRLDLPRRGCTCVGGRRQSGVGRRPAQITGGGTGARVVAQRCDIGSNHGGGGPGHLKPRGFRVPSITCAVGF